MFELLPAFKYFCSQHKLALFALNDFLSEDLLSASCQWLLPKLSKALEQPLCHLWRLARRGQTEVKT